VIAILSDIHGNIHALETVLADMPKVDEIWVLGDTVGGGAFPCEVLDRLLNLPIPVTSILGNWEIVLLEGKKGLHPEWWKDKNHPYTSAPWTVDNLKPHHWEYLEGLPEVRSMGDALLYHGRPDGQRGSTETQQEAAEVAAKFKEKWLFGGHIHEAHLFHVGQQRVAVIGSVGLSADGRFAGITSYALFDGENLQFRHLTYDVEAAVKALKASDYGKYLEPNTARAVIATMLSGHNYVGEFMDYVYKHGFEAASDWREG